MSTIIMSTCWALQDMTATQKSVLISLADMANDDGVCWPSVAKISKRTCLSERAVQGAIRWLITSGILSIKEREGRSTIYQITPAAYAPPQQMPPAGDAPTPADGAPTPAAAAPAPAAAAPRTINNHKEPSKEPSNKRGKKSANGNDVMVELLEMILPVWLPRRAWIDWVEHRESLKIPLTLRAAELCISALDKLRSDGNDPELVIHQSVISGKWTNFYPVKVGNQGSVSGFVNTKDRQRQETIDGLTGVSGHEQQSNRIIDITPDE